MYLKVRQGLVALGAAILTFALLWGGQQLNQYTQVEAPLMHSLQAVHGVKKVSEQQGANGALNITVTLASVPSLQDTYGLLTQKLASYAGSNTRLEVKGQPDQTLTNLANEMAFPTEQALKTGDYVTMRKTLLDMGQKAGVKTSVAIDTHNIYLALYDHGHTFYKVVSTGGTQP